MARAPKKPSDSRRVAPPSSPAPTDRPRIALFVGEDDFLLHNLTQRLRERLVADVGADALDVLRFDGESAQPADVFDECRSFGLIARHKLVIVDHADRFVAGDNRALIERYADAPSDDATLVLRASKWHKGNLDKRIAAVGVIEHAEPPTPAKAAGWAVARCAKHHGAELTRDAAVALVAQVGTDLGRIDTELAKLSCATSAPGDPITADHVREWVGRSGEEDLWAVQTPLASAEPSTALAGVRDAITLWRQSPTGVLYAEIDLIRKAAAVARLLEQGEQPFAAAKRARIWGNTEPLVAVARRAPGGTAALADLFSRAIDTDVKSKTGWADPALACETLAVRWCSVGRGSADASGQQRG